MAMFAASLVYKLLTDKRIHKGFNMKNKKLTALALTGALLCSLVIGLQSQVHAEKCIEKTIEHKTTDHIMRHLSDGEMREQLDHLIDSHRELDDDVGFRVKDGVITLRGVVDNESERELAGRLAREVEGATKIENVIRVEN
jgi:osmotically-inducible protein OsmY